MNLTFDQAESELKSSIQSDIKKLQNKVISMAQRGRTNNEFAAEEAAFIRQVKRTKDAASQRCDDAQKIVTSKRPSPNAPEREKEDYRTLLRYANEGMSRLQVWITNIFNQLINIVRQIVDWIWDSIVDIGTRIGSAFRDVIDLFF
ncbi:hypothetical protein I4U23_017330 [Adineta vaga]|nr:hypothetical protein I4U23_017330 [Adineta vaga]